MSLSPDTIERYRNQVDAYLRATGAPDGVIVFLTSGRGEPVAGKARS